MVASQRVPTLALVVTALSLICITAASGHPSDEKPDLNSISGEDLKDLTVKLERTACRGDCPAYSLTIRGDGRVEYDGQNYVKEKGSRQGQVEVDRVKTLISEFAKANFFSLPEEYSDARCRGYCSHMPTVITELSLRGATHRVKHYHGCIGVPKTLFDLEDAIDKLANAEQWTGDVSKTGPVSTGCTGVN